MDRAWSVRAPSAAPRQCRYQRTGGTTAPAIWRCPELATVTLARRVSPAGRVRPWSYCDTHLATYGRWRVGELVIRWRLAP